MRTISIATLMAAICGTLWAADAPSEERIRASADKAIALLQKTQQVWVSKQRCNSCHQVLLPPAAFRDAREHGIAVDEKIAAASAASILDNFKDIDKAVQLSELIDPGFDDSLMLIAADAAGFRINLLEEIAARHIARRQAPDGHWDSLDPRPPQKGDRIAATALSLRAIDLCSHPSLKAEAHERIARARSWLLSQTARNTEERTYQLLGLLWSGADRPIVDKLAGDLAATQQSDGGWNSLNDRVSDAYSSGEALVALHDAGSVPITDPSWQRGIEFLLRTQAADGSWHVTTRVHPPAPVSPPYSESGYPYAHDQFISAMGTSMAIMALARALGPARKIELPAQDYAPAKNIEPWAETVLFGSADELRRLLDSGFSPNSATKDGTTALMMAAPDVEKMKLLLDRGADLNGRAKSKYSAIMVAALYPQATPAIQMLLDRGAHVHLPQGQGAPLYRVSTMFLAAFAGNAQVLKLLRDAGDSADDIWVLEGTTPLSSIALRGETEMVRALLDAGVKVDGLDASGITALSWAAIANQVETARLLIERGAQVNHVDKKGMTPLLYAASNDYGDSAMLDLLLKSGANPNARTNEGRTALDLARKYGHKHLLASLERESTPK